MTTPTLEPRKFAVLYVDDEEQALKYFRKGLEKDFEICTAAGAAPALGILEKESDRIGVVITDQRMPQRSGVSLLTEVRSRWPAIVRVLITAYTDMDSAVAAVNAGAVYKYITKPADFPLLRQTLGEAIDLHRETRHRDAMAQTLRQLEAQRQATLAAESQREQLQQRLVAASHQAGRAEVATGILHNVGNVLNSLNVSAAVVSDTLLQSRIDNLCKGLAMFEQHGADLVSFLTTDERGQRLPGYLAKLAPVLAQEHAKIADAVTSLRRNVDHIVQIVRMQQEYAKDVVVQEPIDPVELMECAVRIKKTPIEQQSVKLIRQYAPVPVLLLDRNRILQILINLVSNAIRATTESQAPTRQITLKIWPEPAATPPQVAFQVSDNGMGIAPENLTRIFTYGFTTHTDGHGFGLHSAANAAKEMGGELMAASDGLASGASFTLRVPMKDQTASAPQQGDAHGTRP